MASQKTVHMPLLLLLNISCIGKRRNSAEKKHHSLPHLHATLLSAVRVRRGSLQKKTSSIPYLVLALLLLSSQKQMAMLLERLRKMQEEEGYTQLQTPKEEYNVKAEPIK